MERSILKIRHSQLRVIPRSLLRTLRSTCGLFLNSKDIGRAGESGAGTLRRKGVIANLAKKLLRSFEAGADCFGTSCGGGCGGCGNGETGQKWVTMQGKAEGVGGAAEWELGARGGERKGQRCHCAL